MATNLIPVPNDEIYQDGVSLYLENKGRRPNWDEPHSHSWAADQKIPKKSNKVEKRPHKQGRKPPPVLEEIVEEGYLAYLD